jgi:hypothetical protein
MLNVAKQRILFCLGASFLLTGVAVLGFIEPAIRSTLEEVIDFAMTLNALWARWHTF